MNCYVVLCTLTPKLGVAHLSDISHAESNTWVMAESLEEAKRRVFEFLDRDGWQVTSVTDALRSMIELHPHLQSPSRLGGTGAQITARLSYESLLRFGIGSEIFTVKKNAD